MSSALSAYDDGRSNDDTVTPRLPELHALGSLHRSPSRYARRSVSTKREPFAQLARRGKVSAHSARQVTTDREAKPGSGARVRRCGAHLNKRLEDRVELSAGMPRPVSATSMRTVLPSLPDRGASQRDLDHLPREFHGIREQIEENLNELFSVRADVSGATARPTCTRGAFRPSAARSSRASSVMISSRAGHRSIT